ncbi:unnamed protein product [Effrenium voratum]|nr:unnamed protein product [Effrenium voratum]
MPRRLRATSAMSPPRTEIWTTTASRTSRAGWVPTQGDGFGDTFMKTKAELEQLKRTTSTNKAYLPIVKMMRQAPEDTQRMRTSLYPDLTHRSRARQLLRRWESLPSLPKQLGEEDMRALEVSVGPLNIGKQRGAKVVREESPGKEFPFIPCSCCERESPIKKLREKAGMACSCSRN